MDKITRSEKTTITPLYMTLSIVFVSCLLISNIAATKLFQFGSWSLTAAVIVFPLSYIINDVIAEVYGFKAARRVMWHGFAMNFLMVTLFMIVIALPVPVWFENGEAFASVLGNTPRLFAASMAAYIVGSWVNAATLSKLKLKMNGKGFGIRAIISTLLGEAIDSLIFVPIAFMGVMPTEELLKMMLLQVTFKSAYEVLVLPVTSLIVRKVKAIDNVDVIDQDVSYGLIG